VKKRKLTDEPSKISSKTSGTTVASNKAVNSNKPNIDTKKPSSSGSGKNTSEAVDSPLAKKEVHSSSSSTSLLTPGSPQVHKKSDSKTGIPLTKSEKTASNQAKSTETVNKSENKVKATKSENIEKISVSPASPG